ncbi:hypothetical protein J3R82DRAFT_9814 [Butyriboletus roseoflavus]|nr:hypothetical protein J3R82DRAFT_9814 [Butyriboletus roseoflavus]
MYVVPFVESWCGVFSASFVQIHDIYRDRVALEREYASKLQLLAKKATDKKNKAATSLVAGDSPTKPCSDSTIQQNTLINAYAQIITSISKVSQDHVQLADTITVRVTEPLKALERRNESLKRKQSQFYQNCSRNANAFIRIGSNTMTTVPRSMYTARNRLSKIGTLTVRRGNMNNTEMICLLARIANKVKDKFYTEDLPNLEDVRDVTLSLQFTAGNSPNHYPEFPLPSDWKFEPCTSHYDTDEICLESSPKVFLQNKLIRSRGKLQELESVLSAKRNEVEKYTNLIASYSADNTLGNIDDAVNGYLDAQHQVAFFATSEVILHTEIDIIAAALGDDEGGSSPHDFKSSSFSIPTTCGYCKTSIWGLSKLGKTCKACGFSVHAKCELKVPAECTGVRGDHKVAETPSRASSTVSRKETRSESFRVASLRRPTSTHSSAADAVGDTPTPSSFVQDDAPPGYPPARVAFDFSASSPFELSVSEGATVHVVEDDDGSGWVKVTDNHGGKGLVPASYLETADVKSVEPSGSSEEPRTSGQFVRVMYDYEAQGPDELSIKEGEVLELSYGGQDRADGWWEGYSNDGRKGIFPSNYVRPFLAEKKSNKVIEYGCGRLN